MNSILLCLALATPHGADPGASRVLLPAGAPIGADFRLLVDDGTGALEPLPWAIAPGSPAFASAGSTPVTVAELGIDADYEYFVSSGSTVENTVGRILTLLEAVNQQWETQLGIRHEVTTLVVRSEVNDPYTTSSPVSLFNEFRNEWNTNLASEPRDLAQLFTGKVLLGGQISLAQGNSVCLTPLAYALAAPNALPHAGCATDIVSDALGYCWGGLSQSAVIQCSNSFNPTVVSEILAFAATRTCLDTLTPGDCTLLAGTGVNPEALACFSPPLIGKPWQTGIVATGATTTALVLVTAPLTPLATPFGELLVDLASVQLAFESRPVVGAASLYEFQIPAVPALVGVAFYGQGLIDFAQATNAIAVTIGG